MIQIPVTQLYLLFTDSAILIPTLNCLLPLISGFARLFSTFIFRDLKVEFIFSLQHFSTNIRTGVYLGACFVRFNSVIEFSYIIENISFSNVVEG